MCSGPVDEHCAASFDEGTKERCFKITETQLEEKNARTKVNMLIIVIKKALSDPPFNSASVLLSGRLRLGAAKETFPFLFIPASLGNIKTSRDKMLHHFLVL